MKKFHYVKSSKKIINFDLITIILYWYDPDLPDIIFILFRFLNSVKAKKITWFLFLNRVKRVINN